MDKRLSSDARVVVVLNMLYSGAVALSTIFVSVYLWVNSHDFQVIFRHHLVLYAVTPVVFILAGWYSQVRDRLHVYRLGLALHAVFYGTLLVLREQSPEYAGWLGALLGVTWGVYWVGANTLSFDVTSQGRREYFFGMSAAVTGAVSLLAPVLGGFVIQMAGETQRGYHLVFGIVVLLFVLCLLLSFRLPHDGVRRPFKILRALFPGRDQRDWRLMMATSASLTGAFHIFTFLLGLLMFVETANELAVGGYASFQGLVAVVVSLLVSRTITPRTRRTVLRWGTISIVAAGCLMAFPLSVTMLFLFGLLRSVSGSLFGIPHAALNLDIIAKSAEDPGQRIEYLCAWEVPLALGRIFAMGLIIALYHFTDGAPWAIRVFIFTLCALRIISYQLMIRTSPIRDAVKPVGTAAAAVEPAVQ